MTKKQSNQGATGLETRVSPSRKKHLLPAAVLVLGLALVSCSVQSSADGETGSVASGGAAAPVDAAGEAPAAEAAAPAVGVPFTADMGSGNKARITIVSAEYTDSVSAESFAPAAQNGGFLLLDVLWETEEGVTSANPLYFDAKDAEGRRGEMYPFADGQLGSGEVLPGDKSRGFIAFDIAPGAASVTVTDPMLQAAARIEIAG